MKNTILSLTLLLSLYSFSQTKVIIFDKASKGPVPYVNLAIVDKNIEFNADEKGIFVLPDTDKTDILRLSAVGYADAALRVSEIGDTIFMHQKPIELAELVIGSRKNVQTRVIKPAKKAKKRGYGAGGGLNGSLLHALYIPFKPEYSGTPFLNTLKLKIQTDKAYTFNIRLYSVNPDGSPGYYLHDENILVAVKDRQSSVKVDLSGLSIRIPEEGMFVILEHLAIRSNRLGRIEGEDKYPAHQYGYGPLFQCEFSDTKGGWQYKDGKWSENKKTENGYGKMVIEVTLTD